MTKYSKDFKAKIVSEYLSGGISQNTLAKKYQIRGNRVIGLWVRRAKTQGLDALTVRNTHREYSSDFKLSVI